VTLAFVVAGYLIGSIPSGVLLARLAGIDVRRAGSGNIGATNVARTAGLRLGLATLLADALKGFVPVAAARWMDVGTGGLGAVALAAVAGHLYPVTLGFVGGKGVATALGVSLALFPLATAPTVALFAAVVAVGGYVSLGSMAAASAAPCLVWILGYPAPFVGVSAVLAGAILVRHRDNAARLLAGTEPRFRSNRKQASPEK
jgi:glycerol-3-phosphate acyltransferase PlsY